MLLRGSGKFSGNMVNMETVQMIRIVNIKGVGCRIVAYVKTGASITGPVNVTLTHPATKTETVKSTATTGNSQKLNLGSPKDIKITTAGTARTNPEYKKSIKHQGSNNVKYSVGLITDNDKATYYSSRDTNNLYLIRQILGSFNDNLALGINSLVSAIGILNNTFINYKNDSRSYYSADASKNTNVSVNNNSDRELKDWTWIKGNRSTESGKPLLDDILKYKPTPKTKEEKLIQSYGIEIIELGSYSNTEDAEVELNYIQREYSKYIRGELSCFNPPKVYRLSVPKVKVDDIKFGEPNDKINGASYRFTTEIYVTKDNILIADPGCYIGGDSPSSASYWLRAGIDYDIDFPKVADASISGGELVYRFKGQYQNIGIKKKPCVI